MATVIKRRGIIPTRKSIVGWRRLRSTLEGILELRPIAQRHGMPFKSVASRPLVLGQMIRAEQPVKQREMDRKIHIDRLALDAMVPVMKARRDEEFFDDRKAPVQVRMD